MNTYHYQQRSFLRPVNVDQHLSSFGIMSLQLYNRYLPTLAHHNKLIDLHMQVSIWTYLSFINSLLFARILSSPRKVTISPFSLLIKLQRLLVSFHLRLIVLCLGRIYFLNYIWESIALRTHSTEKQQRMSCLAFHLPGLYHRQRLTSADNNCKCNLLCLMSSFWLFHQSIRIYATTITQL